MRAFALEGVRARPWAYLVKYGLGTRVERHTHNGNVIHYLIDGEWLIGGQRNGPRWFHIRAS